MSTFKPAKRTARKKATQHHMTTQVGAYAVPLRNVERVGIIDFPEGPYAFWACVLKDARIRVGRALVGYSAGDRWDRMGIESRASWIRPSHRKAYGKIWERQFKRGRNIDHIRAATKEEIEFWMVMHPRDAEKAAKR